MKNLVPMAWGTSGSVWSRTAQGSRPRWLGEGLCSSVSRGPPGSASIHVQLPEAGVGWGGVTYTVVLDILLRCYTMSLAFWQDWFLWGTQNSTPRKHWSSKLQRVQEHVWVWKGCCGAYCVSVFILMWDRGLRAYYVWLYAFNFYSLD